METLSSKKTNQEPIIPSLTIIDPNLYYNTFYNQSLLMTRPPQNQISYINPQIINTSTKQNTSAEVSLISLLNAIHYVQSQKSKNELINKNDSLSSESEKLKDSFGAVELLTQKTKRNQKFCDACPHKNAPHYAKGMCSNCYHSRGRKKKPWKCPHSNKFHYALGLCQNCYQMRYMKKQNDEGKNQEENFSDIDDLSNNSVSEDKKKKDLLNKKNKSGNKSGKK